MNWGLSPVAGPAPEIANHVLQPLSPSQEATIMTSRRQRRVSELLEEEIGLIVDCIRGGDFVMPTLALFVKSDP